MKKLSKKSLEVLDDCRACRLRYTASLPLPKELRAFTSEPIALTDGDMARFVMGVVDELRRTTHLSMPEVRHALIQASGGSPPTFYDAVCKTLASLGAAVEV